MSVFDYNYDKFLEEGAKENVGLKTLYELNKLQKEYFKPRLGAFNLGDAVGILTKNPFSMSMTGITALASLPEMLGRGKESTRGITGLNLQDVFNINRFGSDEDPTKDPYGINIVSGLGNYQDYVTQKARELAKMKFRTDSANKRKDFYQKAFAEIEEQQRAEQAAQRARDRARSAAAYATQTGEDSGYTGGFDPSTGNYDDPFDPGQTE